MRQVRTCISWVRNRRLMRYFCGRKWTKATLCQRPTYYQCDQIWHSLAAFAKNWETIWYLVKFWTDFRKFVMAFGEFTIYLNFYLLVFMDTLLKCIFPKKSLHQAISTVELTYILLIYFTHYSFCFDCSNSFLFQLKIYCLIVSHFGPFITFERIRKLWQNRLKYQSSRKGRR